MCECHLLAMVDLYAISSHVAIGDMQLFLVIFFVRSEGVCRYEVRVSNFFHKRAYSAEFGVRKRD